MKKLIALLLVISICMAFAACGQQPNEDKDPKPSKPTAASDPTEEPTIPSADPTDPVPTQPTVPQPTEPQPTEPVPTEPLPTDPTDPVTPTLPDDGPDPGGFGPIF